MCRLAARLIAEGLSYDDTRIWSWWFEEIFADLFGLLQIGPTVTRSLQRMFIYLPPTLLSKLDFHLDDNLMNTLLRSQWEAYDATHPVPRVRAVLSIEALWLLKKSTMPQDSAFQARVEKEIQNLESTWNNPLWIKPSPEFEDKVKLTAGPGSPPLDNPTKDITELRKQAQFVLDTILFTPLDALAAMDEQGKLGQRRCVADVFYRQPDYEAIDKITHELLKDQPSSSTEVRNISAIVSAAEYAFEEYATQWTETVLTEEGMKRLNQLGDSIKAAIKRCATTRQSLAACTQWQRGVANSTYASIRALHTAPRCHRIRH